MQSILDKKIFENESRTYQQTIGILLLLFVTFRVFAMSLIIDVQHFLVSGLAAFPHLAQRMNGARFLPFLAQYGLLVRSTLYTWRLSNVCDVPVKQRSP